LFCNASFAATPDNLKGATLVDAAKASTI
jgi:hypothetical protein